MWACGVRPLHCGNNNCQERWEPNSSQGAPGRLPPSEALRAEAAASPYSGAGISGTFSPFSSRRFRTALGGGGRWRWRRGSEHNCQARYSWLDILAAVTTERRGSSRGRPESPPKERRGACRAPGLSASASRRRGRRGETVEPRWGHFVERLFGLGEEAGRALLVARRRSPATQCPPLVAAPSMWLESPPRRQVRRGAAGEPAGR